MKIIIRLIPVVALLSACGNPSQQPATQPQAATQETVEESASKDTTGLAAYIAEADALRSSAEAASKSAKPTELGTEKLRAQIQQKWSKIHYYNLEGNMVRIKTYPYGHSKRTEEFYFKNNELVLAVVEDNGSGEEGQLSKLYYFRNGTPVKEVNNSNEKEGSIRDSDAERLLQEANEYLELKPAS